MNAMVLVLDNSIELDEALFELRRDGRSVSLEPQAFDVLLYLVRHRDRVVAKEELMDEVWGGRFVSETAVTSRIKQVRRALGDDGQAQRVVRTLHGRGYRFVAEVADTALTAPAATAVAQPAPAAAQWPPERAPIRYTTSDGLHIAYQVTGEGDIDIVLISGFVSHLDLDWDDPRHAHFLERLGSMGRLIRFDKRGTGMSDRPRGVPDLEHRMHDVLAVMDAVGSDRAVVCGYSEGGPMALMLAAMHPERVHSLVLYGTYARRTRAEDYPWAQTQEARAAYTDQLVTRWDWEADLLMRCPSGDEAMQRWWAHRMRAAATPGTIRALMDMNSLVDVRDLLPNIGVPTLVLHRSHDAMFSVEEARYLADRIPGATFVELSGADHFVSGDPDQILDAIEPFVAVVPKPEHRFALAAVVFPSGQNVDDVITALTEGGGRRRHTASGDVVVLFDGPATAVRTALAAMDDQRDACFGLAIAEVAVDGGAVTGQGVELAVRLGDTAVPGELLISSTAAVLLAPTEMAPRPVEVDRAVPEGTLKIWKDPLP
jgi:pimeloyl-ACP methyl ester carboxylesterase/DNA-binding winged helix-turn-helix (wHTH) protein